MHKCESAKDIIYLKNFNALYIAQERKKVTIVEMRDELAPDANVRHRPLLLKQIEELVEVCTGFRGLEITSEGVVCEDKEQKQHLVKGSSIICALGQRARTDVVQALQDTAPYVISIHWRLRKSVYNYQCRIPRIPCSTGYLMVPNL